MNDNPKSHFELYLESMENLGADTNLIKDFIKEINSSQSYYESVKKFNIPSVVKEFMDFTFDIIKTNKNHVIASVFTFGREDLIPDMFIEIVKKLSSKNNIKVDLLIYYLERHIELDADEHGTYGFKND